MRARAVLPAGSWEASRQQDTVALDFDRRHRRRIVLETAAGREVLIDLPAATRLRDGDGLEMEGGGVVRVIAAAERLLEIEAHGPDGLARIAWHLGNRHLPVQLLDGRLRIRDDHVMAEMVTRLGGRAATVEAPFDPEAGAYAGGHGHAHDVP